MPPSVRYFSMRYRRAADSRGAMDLMQTNWSWHWLAKGAERQRRTTTQHKKNACARGQIQLPGPKSQGFGAPRPGGAGAMPSHTTAAPPRAREWTFGVPAVASAAAVDAFPLTTLLALRQREEEAAEAEWVAAVAALRAAEARLAGLRDEVEAARGRWEAARGEALSGETLAAWDVAARQRFLTRRRDEWTAATSAEASFRVGALVVVFGCV